MAKVAGTYPDYEQVVGSAFNELPVAVEAAMVVSGEGGHVAYYLAQHPEVVAALAQQPPMVVQHTISKIAYHMRGGGSASLSEAPSPGRPVGNRGSAPLEYPDNATTEQHIAWKKRMGFYGGTKRT